MFSVAGNRGRPIPCFEQHAALRVLPWSHEARESYISRFKFAEFAGDHQRRAVRKQLASEGFDPFERLPLAVHIVAALRPAEALASS